MSVFLVRNLTMYGKVKTDFLKGGVFFRTNSKRNKNILYELSTNEYLNTYIYRVS